MGLRVHRDLAPGLTVLGNLAVDRIDGAPPSPGGCASFAGLALDAFEGSGRIVTRAAAADLPLFADVIAAVGVPIDVLPSETTSGFGLHYDGDARQMTVDAIGPAWDRAAIAEAAVVTEWVHVSSLLRSDFGATTLAALAADGHHIAFDGQGLVRVPQLGRLVFDDAFDPALLQHLAVLKLADDEAAAITGGAPFDEAVARRLAVPEILITAGSAGCDLFLGGERHHVPSAWPVRGVQTTGAGDMFTVSYVAARARGDEPVAAAEVASQLVAELLQVRLESQA
jgi:sugar/nucleoside kinase (ribokinase family)